MSTTKAAEESKQSPDEQAPLREQLIALLRGGQAHATLDQAIKDFPADHRGKERNSERTEKGKERSPEPAPSGRLAERESEGANNDSAIKEEFGDMLFVMANIARHQKLDPEAALRAANQKFVRRFAHIEARLSERGKTPAQSTLAEMDALWDEASAGIRPGICIAHKSNLDGSRPAPG